jgi:hypothetical protein
VSMLFSELSEADQRELLRLVTALRSALRNKGITGEHSEGVRGAGPKANSVG